MEEKNKYWLDEYGERYWYKNSDITISAHRAFYWVDRIIFLNEGSVYEYEKRKFSTSDRRVVGEMTYTKFKKQLNDWTPIENFQEYCKLLKLEYDCRKYNI